MVPLVFQLPFFVGRLPGTVQFLAARRQGLSFAGFGEEHHGEEVHIARLVGTGINGHDLPSARGSGGVTMLYNRTTHAEAEQRGVYRQSAASHPITDMAACLFKCRQDERCVAFVDHFEDFEHTRCELKTTLQMEFTERGATTDVYTIPMDSFVKQAGIDFPGGDIRNLDGPPTASAAHPARRYYNGSGLTNPQASCAIACLQDVACVGFVDVHHGESGHGDDAPFCLLKESLNETCCENNYTHLATNFYRKTPSLLGDQLVAAAAAASERQDSSRAHHQGKNSSSAKGNATSSSAHEQRRRAGAGAAKRRRNDEHHTLIALHDATQSKPHPFVHQ